MDDVKKRRFLWGVALAWTPWIPMVIGLAKAFRGISKEKATGLVAVAGGLAETFVEWGIGAMLIGQVIAIILLSRAFSPGNWKRSLFSVLSIGLSALMIVFVGLFLWLLWFQAHQTF
jgi:hypothetical protein